ncbi:MAG TPA: hypothetical protein VNX26_13800 [Candidatus Acidoferrum sp.]|jgi:hypothetical protein|nr:hypothetical protein [Candidatus Acidoferrum sp.]
MGYAISWIALRGKTDAQAAELVGLAPSGKFEEVPESMFSGVRLDNGWYVVVINEYGHKLVRERSLQRVSAAADVVAAAIEEHVMFSSAEAWKNGKLIWRVTHASGSSRRHLEEHGSLPGEYLAVKERLLAARQREDEGAREVDYVFDVPLELSEAIVGFKHDRILDRRFEILKPIAATAGGGLLSRLFRESS